MGVAGAVRVVSPRGADRPGELNRSEGRRHKTPVDLARQLLATLIHWFPRRKFVLLGDGGYASHELARFCHLHRRHVTLVSRFHPQANLYEAPSTNRSKKPGRPRTKGRRLAKPQEAAKRSGDKRFTVNWYGGKLRRVELIRGEGHWYKAGTGLVPVRRVFVRDIEATHRDEYFYSTDPTMPPDRMVSLYTGRWSIERIGLRPPQVTFQEVRAHLGLATPRNWSRKSVLRTAPCLLGLFSVVSLMFHRHTRQNPARPASFAWYAKAETTLGDALTCVRRLCWSEILRQSRKHAGVAKLPRPLRIMLLDHLCRAA